MPRSHGLMVLRRKLALAWLAALLTAMAPVFAYAHMRLAWRRPEHCATDDAVDHGSPQHHSNPKQGAVPTAYCGFSAGAAGSIHPGTTPPSVGPRRDSGPLAVPGGRSSIPHLQQRPHPRTPVPSDSASQRFAAATCPVLFRAPVVSPREDVDRMAPSIWRPGWRPAISRGLSCYANLARRGGALADLSSSRRADRSRCRAATPPAQLPAVRSPGDTHGPRSICCRGPRRITARWTRRQCINIEDALKIFPSIIIRKRQSAMCRRRSRREPRASVKARAASFTQMACCSRR